MNSGRIHAAATRSLTALLLAAGSVCVAEEKPTMTPDYAALQFTGNGHRQDSFVLAVQAAARLFGKTTDYDTLTCLAGNAFAPFRNLEEDCTSHCQLEAVYSDRAMATVAAYVGLRARKLEFPPYQGFDVSDEDRPAYLKQVAQTVRAAMDAGEVVIALQGWKVDGPHGFTHWGYAGIVTDADPATGTILGAHLNGRKDNPIYHGAVMWAVAPGEATLKSPEAEQVMLRQAVDYIRGRGLFTPRTPVVYGLAAMDAWIEHMQTVKGYCAPCWGRGQKSWHDAMENGERLLRGARIAARKLRTLGPDYEAAARHYDRIADLLEPVKYSEFIGDIDRQKVHARTVLTPVKAELSAVAREMEKALVSAEDGAPGQVRSASVARLVDQEQTAVAGRGYAYNVSEGYLYNPVGLVQALVVALRHAGDAVTYEEFAAASGWAFSFGYRYDDRSTSNLSVSGRGEPLDPHDVFRVGLEQRGYGLESVRVRDRETFWTFVKRHVDADTPVVSEQFDGGLIYGYREKAGARQVWFDGPVGGPAWVDVDKLQPASACVLVKRGEAPTPEVFLRQALTRVAALASAHDFRGVPQGLAALEAYAADVANPAKSFEKTSEWFCWATFERLGARCFCGPWLRQAAETLGGSAHTPLQTAAERYERAGQIYARYYRETRRANEDTRPSAERLRTPERAAELASILEQAIAAERLGVAELQRAATNEAIPASRGAGPASPSDSKRRDAASTGTVLLQAVADAYAAAVKERRSMNHSRTDLVCRLAVLRGLGVTDVSYDDLVMVAGWGTSFAYHPQRFGIIFQYPDDPKRTEERLAQLTGWQWTELGNFKKRPDDAWLALKPQLDAGHAVVGAFLDDYVLLGYEDADQKEGRRVYHVGGWDEPGWWTWEQFAKWCNDWGRIVGVTKTVPRADRRDLARYVIENAVRFAEGDRRKSEKTPAVGLAGMDVYAADIADVSKTPDDFDAGWLGCFCINRQHDARTAAARWFAANADLFGGTEREHVLAAAGHYQAACAAWKAFEGALGRGTGKTHESELRQLWKSKAAREAGAAAVRQAIEHERQAVGELRKAHGQSSSDR